jgi:hypothetical protein
MTACKVIPSDGAPDSGCRKRVEDEVRMPRRTRPPTQGQEPHESGSGSDLQPHCAEAAWISSLATTERSAGTRIPRARRGLPAASIRNRAQYRGATSVTETQCRRLSRCCAGIPKLHELSVEQVFLTESESAMARVQSSGRRIRKTFLTLMGIGIVGVGASRGASRFRGRLAKSAEAAKSFSVSSSHPSWRRGGTCRRLLANASAALSESDVRPSLPSGCCRAMSDPPSGRLRAPREWLLG